MAVASFPDAMRNAQIEQLRNRLATDPRTAKDKQSRPKPPTIPPSRVRRAGFRGLDWGLTRSLRGYVCVPPEALSIQGKAPKWILLNRERPEDFYIAKLGSKNGRVEVLTELFNNELGAALGFPMAHHGIVRLDELLYFLTRNFREPGTALVHGSLLIADALQVAPSEMDRISHEGEQSFYDVPFVHEAIRNVCGDSADAIFQQLLDMLVYDALIGCCDRHSMNWGILRSEKGVEGGEAQFAPIFDTARALVWDLTEAKLLEYEHDDVRLDAYLQRSCPCIGPKRPSGSGFSNLPEGKHKEKKINHFDLVANLRAEYPHQTARAYSKVTGRDIVAEAKCILSRYPYKRGFTGLRKRVIIKILEKRSILLAQVAGDSTPR